MCRFSWLLRRFNWRIGDIPLGSLRCRLAGPISSELPVTSLPIRRVERWWFKADHTIGKHAGNNARALSLLSR